MIKVTTEKVHWSFWLISVIALLWNMGGVINYLMQMNPEFVATLPETHRAIIQDRPVWATGGFAMGVFGGAIGCILLLLKKSAAFYIFTGSLLGIIITMIHTSTVASSKIDFSLSEVLVMILSPIIVAILLLWYSRIAIRKSWIN